MRKAEAILTLLSDSSLHVTHPKLDHCFIKTAADLTGVVLCHGNAEEQFISFADFRKKYAPIVFDNDWEIVQNTKYMSFRQVITNSEDQVTVRRLLMEHVPEYAKKKIVQEFNKEFNTRHKK